MILFFANNNNNAESVINNAGILKKKIHLTHQSVGKTA